MKRALPTSIRLDPEIKAGLERAATADGRSISNLLDRILREWLVAKGHLGSATNVEAQQDALLGRPSDT